MKLFQRSSTCVALVFYSFLFSQDSPKPAIDGIAAVIGENIILRSDVSQIVLMTAVQRGMDPVRDQESILALQNYTIQSLIDQKVVLSMAELDSVTVSEKDVNNALDQQIEMFVSQAGGEDRAEKMLGQSIRSFRREFWYEMQEKLITEIYQRQLISKVTVNRGDVITFFDTFQDSIPPFPTRLKMRHLLIKIKPGEVSRQKSLQLISELRNQILAGESFESLAKSYSHDPGSAQHGGSLGFVRRGALVKEFESVAFTLEPGIISQPIETPFGFHLIETLEKRGDKIHVRHILISPQLTEEDENRAYHFANTLKDSSSSLEFFKELIVRHSEDDNTKSFGGDLGWVDLNNYAIKEFKLVADQLEVNKINGPVKTEYGFHLLWVEGLRPGGKPSLERHWMELESLSLNHKRMRWYSDWLSNARSKFYISRLN